MMNYYFLFVCLLGLGPAVRQQTENPKPITGRWSGTLQVQQHVSLPLVFTISTDPNSNLLTATVDSPSQGANGIPVEAVQVTPDSIYLQIPAIGGTYAGKRAGQRLDGKWIQNGASLPLIMSLDPSR